MSGGAPSASYAVVFPGQGSQAVGMGVALAEAFPEAAEVMERADRVIPGLWRLCREGPEEVLRQTSHTQPAILSVCVAAWAVWRRHVPGNRLPAAGAGHSLGEYTALVASGCLEFEAALKLVRARGELMERAVPDGAGGMGAVIGLDDDAVRRICAAVSEQSRDPAAVVPANFNAPGQVVVSGLRQALDEVRARVEQAGGRYMELSVSGPFHSPWMKGAAERFRAHLQSTSFAEPAWPVVANVTARPLPSEPESIREHLFAQLASPVRWAESLRAMAAMGVSHFVEIGPGRALSGM
ncbi:MAG: ACP S-malonyltransferase, partial [Bacillota bacterium]